MTKAYEIKQKILAKKDEIENFQRLNQKPQALKAVDDLNNLLDALKIEEAKEKADFEHFMKHKQPINQNFNTSHYCAGVDGEEYHKQFFDAFRQKFKNTALRESVPSQGGYLVPAEFGEEILSKLAEENLMRQIGRVIQTEYNREIAIVNTPPAADWVAEGATINLTTETFDQVTLGAHKLAAAISVTNEVLADSYFDLETHITEEFSKAIAAKEEQAFISGTGIGEPLGVLTSIESDSDSYITATASNWINDENFLRLQYSLPRQYRRNACWLISDNLLPEIMRIKSDDGKFLWQPTLQEGAPPTLLGSPIYTSPFIPSLPITQNKIYVLYGDFSRYYIAERGAKTIKALRELHALSDITTFLMIERVDGRLVDKNAVRGLKVSP